MEGDEARALAAVHAPPAAASCESVRRVVLAPAACGDPRRRTPARGHPGPRRSSADRRPPRIPGSGLERRFDARLGAVPGRRAALRRACLIRRVRVRRGRAVHATIRPASSAAQQALGDRLGGVAVMRPRDGSRSRSPGSPSPPRSRRGRRSRSSPLSAALQNGIAKPSSTYPVQTATRLSGVLLRNASDESCGGSLFNLFAHSCNTVFAPLGAKLGARRLVAAAERFGFNERPRIPSARVNRTRRRTASPSARRRSARTATATPLDGEERRRDDRRARGAREAADRRQRPGHPPPRGSRRGGARGAVDDDRRRPGRHRHRGEHSGRRGRGQDGTAELRPTAGGPLDPKNTDAWFVAFAPASKPRYAVSAMLVGAGAAGRPPRRSRGRCSRPRSARPYAARSGRPRRGARAGRPARRFRSRAP